MTDPLTPDEKVHLAKILQDPVFKKAFALVVENAQPKPNTAFSPHFQLEAMASARLSGVQLVRLNLLNLVAPETQQDPNANISSEWEHVANQS